MFERIDPELVSNCDNCEEGIYDGDIYYDILEYTLCEICVDDSLKTATID